MKLTNVINLCDDGKHRELDLVSIDTLAIHRIGPSLGTDAVTICRRFVDDPEVAKYTGGEVPYTFIIGQSGTIWQCLPLSEIGAHARRWNSKAVGIACIGDFRAHDIADVQFYKLVELCAALQFCFSERLDVRGHDELPGGSSDPLKSCPGKKLNMDRVRKAVFARPVVDRLQTLGIEK